MTKLSFILLALSVSFTSLAAPKFSDLAIGYGYACAHDGSSVSCWGENNYNQVLQFEGLSNIRKIKVHEKFACALDDFGVICWGEAPTLPPEMYTNKVSDFEIVNENVCAVVSGQILCADNNILLKMPRGLNNLSKLVFTEEYYSDDEFGICIIQKGKVICWDKNGRALRIPQPKDFFALEILINTFGGCLLGEENKFSCWDSAKMESVLTEPPKDPGTIMSFYGRATQGCLVNDLGELQCWGMSIQVPSQFKARRVAYGRPVSGSSTYCVLGVDGQIFCRGGEASLSNLPIDAKNALSWNATDKGVCFEFKNELLCSGESYYPKSSVSGLETLTAGSSSLCYQDSLGPKCFSGSKILVVPADVKSVSQFSVSYNEIACGIVDENKVKCWGEPRFGAAAEILRDTPQELKGIKKLSAGRSFVCALTDLKKLHCWGKPPGPLSSEKILDFQAGVDHYCTLSENDSLNCFGLAENPPSHLVNIRGVISGWNFSCAYTDSEVACWGGAFNPAILTTPQVVGKIKKIQSSPSASHACLEDDEKIRCWGSNRKSEYVFFQ